ncbi:MAG: DUF3052 domain-containing protein [Pseudonocardiales bacterium]
MTGATGYSDIPLPRKLGVNAESRLLLDGAPPGFTVSPLPSGVTVHTRPGAEPYDVVLTFCPDRGRLQRRFTPLSRRLTTAGALWVCWPKRASGVPTDVDENIVRACGIAAGLVDVKVCAVDAVWSGLKFVVRLKDR